MNAALTALTSTLFGTGGVIPTVFSWVTSSDVIPFLAIGIGCSLALFGVKVNNDCMYKMRSAAVAG